MDSNNVDPNSSRNDVAAKKCPGCYIYKPKIYDCNKCVHKEFNNSWRINVFSKFSKEWREWI